LAQAKLIAALAIKGPNARRANRERAEQLARCYLAASLRTAGAQAFGVEIDFINFRARLTP